MKRTNNYIAAFTIVEALISMVITAIILSVIFVIFSITSERLLDFKKQNETISDYNRLNYCINKTIFETSRIELAGSEELIFSGNYGSTVHFHLQENYFVMEAQSYIDTFHLKTAAITLEALESVYGKKFQRLKWKLNINDKEMEMNFYMKVYENEVTGLIQ